MTADELFKAGRLGDAIEAQNAEVKQRPADLDARFLLFVLLCFAGELERAERQLDVLGNQDEKIKLGSVLYRSLLAAELERRAVFEKSAKPVLPPDSPANLELRLSALERLRAGDEEAASKRIDEAVEATTALSGRLNGEPYEALRDLDDLLGTVLELFAGGRYLWMPLEKIRSLELSEPSTAIDTLWVPAQLLDANGEEARVHLPALYPGSYSDADDGVRLGRSTQWRERGELYIGSGQRILVTAGGDETSEHPLLSVRTLQVDKA